MTETHLLVPPEVISKLSARFALRHKHGDSGYFGTLTDSELWGIIRSLVNSGYRVDIKPGDIVRLVARKEKNNGTVG